MSGDPEPCSYCGALPCDQVGGASISASEWRERAVDYALHYGPRCRECADEDGVCSVYGLPCDGSRKAAGFVVDALMYGVLHGFLSPPPQFRARTAATHLNDIHGEKQ